MFSDVFLAGENLPVLMIQNLLFWGLVKWEYFFTGGHIQGDFQSVSAGASQNMGQEALQAPSALPDTEVESSNNPPPPPHNTHTPSTPQSGSSRGPGKEVTTSWQHHADTAITGRDWGVQGETLSTAGWGREGLEGKEQHRAPPRKCSCGGSSQPQCKQMQSSITSSVPFHYQTLCH